MKFVIISFYLSHSQYENSLIDDFDLLIIGGYYNDNRTSVDSFLLAVMKPAAHDGDLSVFYSVCKIRNGLSRSQFAEICDKLAPFKHEMRKNQPNPCPDGIEWANADPDFWVDPKHSIVVQIKASELTKTRRYRTSHSFRFPRVIAIRWDKMWNETCSLNEFQKFCAVSFSFRSYCTFFFLSRSDSKILNFNFGLFFTVRFKNRKTHKTTCDLKRFER